MIRGLDLSVYELLGYLLPGSMALTALCLSAGLLEHTVVDPARWAALGWWLLVPLMMAYVLGHLLQALANRLLCHCEEPALRSVVDELPQSGFEAIARRLQLRDPAEETAAWSNGKRQAFLAVCTTIVDQEAKTLPRDVFLYREGFYRGTSLALFAVGFSVALWVWPLWRDGVEATRGRHVGLALGAFALLIWGGIEFLNRYKRFVRYRISACIWGAVIAATASAKAPSEPLTHEMD